jgi:Glucodextranase, domain B
VYNTKRERSFTKAKVAQLVEQRYRKPQVMGSIPILGSKKINMPTKSQNFQTFSRRLRVEEEKNTKKAYQLIVGAIILVFLLVILGIPAITKMLGFLTDVRTSDVPTQTDDTTPPVAPRIDSLPKATNKQSLEIVGSAEPGSTVTIITETNSDEVIANTEGSYRAQIQLSIGENSIKSKATDSSGNQSTESDTIIIVYDMTEPEITITKPSNATNFNGPKERQLTIEGTTEENVQVSINGRHVFVDDEGTFSYTITLTEGENKFSAKAVDEAGNSTETEFSVTYTP